MIKASNIHKSYGDLEVLKGVDVHIKEGEVVSIVGESGAGKSTLLQILGTLDKPTNPKKYNTVLELAGQSFVHMSDRQLSKFRNENIGFVFQYHQLLPEFSALENVLLPTKIAGKNEKESIDKAYSLFEDLHIAHRIHHKPNQMSGGEAQRTAVARALINSPKIIFADEPTGNLDSKNADDLHQLFFDLRDKYHQTFVIVTHNIHLADTTDRKLVMKDGQIIHGL
ncbi:MULTISPECIES: ABC transporter ATP-binding protein [unclassified Kaistella]|uniref:ABC transporter ATP-binding protein n=1 Tax=unclassified Kaistella TaxID=2762626 RepID=UPI0027335C72|nr:MULTISPECIES: ABC transporter ATP-binding protein [unclassified Kaistella]MCZ2085887.1 ABC transporter ATP-binding protein [Flavobacteriales bacterium]MDP2453974.1 ABC transporter ATP-binding protein [Kaistella sp. SH11-4b]MDP2457031.1 ABC transporter ATP-binding protein [Kaistella sp. SH40-3]MDP2459788.1 ABC transporter ATP-binding protein [Kaistella sp. SH19-2b]